MPTRTHRARAPSSPATSHSLSRIEARRVAIVAQGLGAEKRGDGESSPTNAAIDGTIARLGVLQIDAVNVLERAHYVPVFSRLGPYERTRIDDAAYGARRTLFEYWGHQASFVPMSMFPLFRWRMQRAAELRGIYAGLARFVRRRRAYVEAILREVEERGPVRAGELTQAKPRKGGWWGWSDAKRALEWLFWAGFVTTHSRKQFERTYDLTSRVVPAAIHDAPPMSEHDAHRELLRHAARSLGIATEDDLADYYRLRLGDVRVHLQELVDEGLLERVHVDGVVKPMFLVAGTKIPGAHALAGRAVLSPFDPLVWYRPRTERLFGFHYRIEIYTPEHLRKHGYYVLPFLRHDRLAARVDLKADRAASVLLVQAAHLEPFASEDERSEAPGAVAESLAAELANVARWLGLDAVRVARKGSLAKTLGPAVRAMRSRTRP